MGKTKNKICAVCKRDKKVDFIKITDCNLCKKCQKELSKSFDAVNRARNPMEDSPEI